MGDGMRIEFTSRLRRKIKAQGCSGEIRDLDGTAANLQWLPRADQTPAQIALAESIKASYDQVADDAWKLQEERDAAASVLANPGGKLIRAVVLLVLDEFNSHALKINAILDAVDAATSLADLKTRVAAIVDYPPRTAAQLKTAIQNKINAGDADS